MREKKILNIQNLLVLSIRYARLKEEIKIATNFIERDKEKVGLAKIGVDKKIKHNEDYIKEVQKEIDAIELECKPKYYNQYIEKDKFDKNLKILSKESNFKTLKYEIAIRVILDGSCDYTYTDEFLEKLALELFNSKTTFMVLRDNLEKVYRRIHNMKTPIRLKGDKDTFEDNEQLEPYLESNSKESKGKLLPALSTTDDSKSNESIDDGSSKKPMLDPKKLFCAFNVVKHIIAPKGKDTSEQVDETIIQAGATAVRKFMLPKYFKAGLVITAASIATVGVIAGIDKVDTTIVFKKIKNVDIKSFEYVLCETALCILQSSYYMNSEYERQQYFAKKMAIINNARKIIYQDALEKWKNVFENKHNIKLLNNFDNYMLEFIK